MGVSNNCKNISRFPVMKRDHSCIIFTTCPYAIVIRITYTLKKNAQREILPPKFTTKTIHKTRKIRITQRYLVISINHSVAIDIFVFNITGHIFSKRLYRTIIYFLLISE